MRAPPAALVAARSTVRAVAAFVAFVAFAFAALVTFVAAVAFVALVTIAALIAVVVLAVLAQAAGGAAAAGSAGGPAPGTATCALLRVERAPLGVLSTLLRVDLPSGAASTVARLDYRVNAIGLAGGVVHGIASGGRQGTFPDGGHVLTIDGTGRVTDLGPVGALPGVPLPAGGFGDAPAGAGHGTRLHLRDGGWLYTLDVDPASPSYRHAIAAVRLSPARSTLTVDDFDVNPADGLLYGVSHGGQVISIDPATGEVHAVPGQPPLPAGTSYGAVTFGPDGALYAAANGLWLRSRLFRVPLDGSEPAEVASRPAVASADAARCAPPPIPPPPVPPPSPIPPPPVPPSPVPPPPTAPPPPGPRPPGAFPPASTLPLPPPSRPAATPPPQSTPPGPAPGPSMPSAIRTPSSGAGRPAPTEPRSSRHTIEQTEAKRRWGLTVLLLILGAGAAARMAARRH